MQSKKHILTVTFTAIFLLASSVICVFADTLRIAPDLPTMVSSPADFELYIVSGAPAQDPHIFLVMTESSWDGWTAGDLTVTWPGAISPVSLPKLLVGDGGQWTEETDHLSGKKVPISDGYTVASLMSHLETTDPIYWTFQPILDGAAITTTRPGPTITVTLPSSSPEMLVYIFGKSGSSEFNNRVPPTNPGFVVPEPATIAAVAVSFVALAGYIARRRRQ